MSKDARSTPAGHASTTEASSATDLRQGQQYLVVKRYPEADAMFRRVLQKYPRDAQAWHGRGIIAADVGKIEQAITCFRKAIANRHDFTVARLDLARVLQRANRLDEANVVATAAARSDPNSSVVHLVLGNILCDRGEVGGGAIAYQQAIDLDQTLSEPRFRLGLAYQQLGRYEDAATALEGAIGLDPERAELHYSLGTIQHTQCYHELALASYDRALNLRPSLADELFAVGKPRHIHVLMDMHDFAGALLRLDRFLADVPGQSCALALKAVVLDELGQFETAESLLSYKRFIRCVKLNPAVGTIGALNDGLSRHILEHPSLREAPASYSVEGGKTTGDLLRPTSESIKQFEPLIREAVRGFVASLASDETHPFITRRPINWTISMWANIIGAKGYQVPHIHPTGWLSAVYYVRVPTEIHSEGTKGWIEFGELYDDVSHDVERKTLALKPEEGLLIMFPSFFYHRTLPFESDATRISIAFDIIPS